jgi:hypothetical protein
VGRKRPVPAEINISFSLLFGFLAGPAKLGMQPQRVNRGPAPGARRTSGSEKYVEPQRSECTRSGPPGFFLMAGP